ncbi:hypothetical protein FKM82_011337 [Ascaphus truei]
MLCASPETVKVLSVYVWVLYQNTYYSINNEQCLFIYSIFMISYFLSRGGTKTIVTYKATLSSQFHFRASAITTTSFYIYTITLLFCI